MKSKKSGISMGGSIENTRKVEAVKSNCSQCYHIKQYKSNVKYCDFYKIDKPNKKYCKRFHKLEKLSKEEQDKIKEHNKALKKKQKEANTPKNTSLENLGRVLECNLTIEMIFCNKKRNTFGNGKLKIQAIDSSDNIIDVFFNDKNKSKQRYRIIKTK